MEYLPQMPIVCKHCKRIFDAHLVQGGRCHECRRGQRCPDCGGEIAPWRLICEECDNGRLCLQLNIEHARQDSECQRMDREAWFVMASQRFPRIYRLDPRDVFIAMPDEHYKQLMDLPHIKGVKHVYPTGSRYIAPWACKPDTDWDFLTLIKGEALEQFLAKGWEERFDGTRPDPWGSSLYKGQVNLILFYKDTRGEKHYEAWRAATVWCRLHEGQYNLRADRVQLFEQAVAEEWTLFPHEQTKLLEHRA